MNKSRIEELAEQCFLKSQQDIFLTPESIRAALTACARETVEECAKVCEQHAFGSPVAAAAIRKLGEGL